MTKKREERKKGRERGTSRGAAQKPCSCPTINVAGRGSAARLLARHSLCGQAEERAAPLPLTILRLYIHTHTERASECVSAGMRLRLLLCIVFFLLASLLPADGQRTGKEHQRSRMGWAEEGTVAFMPAVSTSGVSLTASNTRFLPFGASLYPPGFRCRAFFAASVCVPGISVFTVRRWRDVSEDLGSLETLGWAERNWDSRQATVANLLPRNSVGTGEAGRALFRRG